MLLALVVGHGSRVGIGKRCRGFSTVAATVTSPLVKIARCHCEHMRVLL